VVLVIWAFSANAQLKVLSNGNVGVGTTNPSQKLEVNGNIRLANSGGLLYKVKGVCFTWSSSYGTNNYHGIFSTDKGSPYSDDITLNSYGNIRLNFDSNNNGTNEFSIGSNTRYGSNTRFYIGDNGFVGIGTSSPSQKLHIYNGSAYVDSYTPNWGKAIYAKIHNRYACSYNLWNTYYNKDVFYVCGDGYLWALKGGYFGSDKRLKKDIKSINNPLEKILKLDGIKFNFKDPINTRNNSDTVNINDTVDINPEIMKEINNEKQRMRIGLIAQDVEKVVPDVVRTMKDGTKAIAYTDLIPLLVEAMKEQQKEIEQLKFEINSLKGNKGNNKSSSLSGNNNQSGLTQDNPILYQNMPNPFTNETKIKYYLPDDTQKASLLIFNMQGTEIKNIKINQFENNFISIKGSELKAGMYFYTLTANGKEIDTKKMILTK